MAGLQRIITPGLVTGLGYSAISGSTRSGRSAADSSQFFTWPIANWAYLQNTYGMGALTFAQQPVTIPQICAVVYRAANFTLTGSLTATPIGGGDPTSIVLDDWGITTTNALGGGKNPNEMQISSGFGIPQFSQSGLGDDGTWTVLIDIILGGVPFQDSSGNLYLGGAGIADPTQGFVYISNGFGSVSDYAAYTGGTAPTDSGIDYTIMPIGSGTGIKTQKLWNSNPADVTWSGNVVLNGASGQFLTWGNKFNASDGTPV